MSEMRGPTARDIDEYIAMQPPKNRKALQQLRRTIRAAAPEATEAISYQIPTFKHHGNLVHFAGFEHHLSFFAGLAVTNEFKRELKGRLSGRATIRFTADDPLPASLVRRIVKWRVAENEARVKPKSRKRPAGKKA